jgi:hypothetical protein
MLHPIPLLMSERLMTVDSAVGDQHIDYPASVASNQVVALLIAGEKELEKVASQHVLPCAYHQDYTNVRNHLIKGVLTTLRSLSDGYFDCHTPQQQQRMNV